MDLSLLLARVLCFGMNLVALVEHCRVALFFLLLDLHGSACIVHSFLAIFRDANFRLPET